MIKKTIYKRYIRCETGFFSWARSTFLNGSGSWSMSGSRSTLGSGSGSGSRSGSFSGLWSAFWSKSYGKW